MSELDGGDERGGSEVLWVSMGGMRVQEEDRLVGRRESINGI